MRKKTNPDGSAKQVEATLISNFALFGVQGFITAFRSQSATAFLKDLVFERAFKKPFDQEKPKRQSIAALQKVQKSNRESTDTGYLIVLSSSR